MSHPFIAAIALTVLLVTASEAAPSSPPRSARPTLPPRSAWSARAVEAKVLYQGSSYQEPTGHQAPFVIDTETKWKTLWKQCHRESTQKQQKALPSVDWKRYRLAVLYEGYKPSPGYGFELRAVEKTAETIVVRYRERRPAAGLSSLCVIVFPILVVQIHRLPTKVLFKKEQAPVGQSRTEE